MGSVRKATTGKSEAHEARHYQERGKGPKMNGWVFASVVVVGILFAVLFEEWMSHRERMKKLGK